MNDPVVFNDEHDEVLYVYDYDDDDDDDDDDVTIMSVEPACPDHFHYREHIARHPVEGWCSGGRNPISPDALAQDCMDDDRDWYPVCVPSLGSGFCCGTPQCDQVDHEWRDDNEDLDGCIEHSVEGYCCPTQQGGAAAAIARPRRSHAAAADASDTMSPRAQPQGPFRWREERVGERLNVYRDDQLFVFVDKSSLKRGVGLGLFAGKSFLRNEVLGLYTGRRIQQDEANQSDYVLHMNGVFIDGQDAGAPYLQRINDSRSTQYGQNVSINDDGVFTTECTMKPSEEFLTSYGSDYWK
jgi:hypothetical protein